jgi:orotidine-5'-phosphate decarboxylase
MPKGAASLAVEPAKLNSRERAPKLKSSTEPFAARLVAAVRARRTPVVVGLDPRIDRLPGEVRARWERDLGCGPLARASAYEEFCCRVVDVVAPMVPAVKVQSAFFEQLGHHGARAMARVMAKARRAGLLVIHDGKRNDIGSTAEAYATGYLDRPFRSEAIEACAGDGPAEACWHSDAMTVNPYLGDDALEPFVRVACTRGAGIFVLVKTSNPGGPRLQDLASAAKPVFRHVAEWVQELAQSRCGDGPYGPIGAVVGATYPEELSELREIMSHAWLLIPGYGAQGASARDVAGAFDDNGLGAVVNSSRGILFAYEDEAYRHLGPDRWEQAVEQATRDMIAELAAETPAGRLLGR